MNEKDYNKVKTALYTALIYDTEKREIIGFDPVPRLQDRGRLGDAQRRRR